MKSTLQVGVVGCGRMGKCRALAAEAYGARVAFVSDATKGTAADLREQLASTDCLALAPQAIELDGIDALFICTPPSQRGEIELAAIDQGIPFLIEKPVGLSAKAVRNIESALVANPVLAAVGYMNRYRKSVQSIREQLRSARVLGVSADWLVGMYGVPWWSRKEGSGGPVNEQATHIIDLARYLVGEIKSVHAVVQMSDAHPDLIGSAAINLLFANGAPASMLYSCQAEDKMIGFRVFTSEVELTLSGWDFHLVGDDSTKVDYEDRNQIFDAEVCAFLDTVADKSDGILCTFQDAMQTQHVVDAIHRSVETGRTEQVVGVG